MNKKLDLSQMKGKVSNVVLISIGMVVLAIVLGVTSWFTIKRSISLSESIDSAQTKLEENRTLIKRLETLKGNSEYYLKQKEEYDKIIADEGTYDPIDYYVELDEMCKKYGLTITELNVGKLNTDNAVKTATTTLAVLGKEADVRRMAAEIVSQPEIARIDDIAMAKNGDGTVVATMTIVNFTK